MTNLSNLGTTGIRPGQRKFTIGWGEKRSQADPIDDVAEATSAFEKTKDIVSSHSTVSIPDYIRASRRTPMWSNDLDPSRSSDLRTLELGDNVYRSEVISEPAPRANAPSRGYRKKSFRLSDEAGTISVNADYNKGKLKSARHFRKLSDGTTETVQFQVNDNGTLTYESLRSEPN